MLLTQHIEWINSHGQLFWIEGDLRTVPAHLGGGAIMKRKPPALHNIGIDLNPRALAAFECDYPVKKVND